MEQKIELRDIIKSEGFIRELNRTAVISYETGGESHFLAYLTENFQVRINEAIRGGKKVTPLGEKFFCPSETLAGARHKFSKGSYIEPYAYSLIKVHFHPPNSSLIPSPGDIEALNVARKQNNNIADLCHSSYEMYVYVNPIEVIGSIINELSVCELLMFQEKTIKPINFEEFMKSMADYLNKKNKTEYDTDTYGLCGFSDCFNSIEEFLRVMNSFRLHTAKLFRITNRDYSELDKIQIFKPQLFFRLGKITRYDI